MSASCRYLVLIAAVAAVVSVSSCTSPSAPGSAGPSQSPPSATPASAASPCPVTRSSGKQPPRRARLNFGSVLAASKTGWVGSGGLWAELPDHGVLLTILNPDTRLYETKFGWFRASPGQVSVTGTPVGGPPASFHSDVGTVPEYGPTGFTPSGLQFAHPGCWRLTGALGTSRLSLVIMVEQTTLP